MIRNQTNELTIRPKMSSSVVMATIVGGLLALIVVAYLSYSAGKDKGYGELGSDRLLVQELNKTVDSLRADLSKTKETLTFAQRQQQIQEEAYKQLSKAYSNSEEKNSVLGSRLDFYRSIISPEDGQTGPGIQSVDSVYQDGVLNFDITLVQAIKHKHQVRGSLRAILYQNEEATVQWPLSNSRSVNYQYFQQISGSFEVPKLSDDAKVKVELTLQGGDKIEEWFPVTQKTVVSSANVK